METTYLNVCDRPISRWSIVRLLKTVLLLLCVSFSSVYVQASDRSEGITISCKNESLEQVIHLIESQSSYLFVLNDKVNTKHKVSIKIENGNINAILNKIFQGTNMTYQVDGDHILISTTHKSIGLDETRQTTMIKGKIVDNAGEPMIGVNVLVKGTTNGAITDFEGNYSLADVNENDVLMVTYIGYLTQEIKVGKQSVINIVMKDDTQSLDEVVVVGYGVQKKSDLTGSISSIKPADITSTPTTNALKSLQGKVAGLDITQSSGQPGASISLTMRGNRSLKADNNPLVLVDGIDYGSFVDINPTDIESIEVLKDISSTAIYGTKGANGVIIITTKRGRSSKPTVNLDAYYGIQSWTRKPQMVTDQNEFLNRRREAMIAAGSIDPSVGLDPAQLLNAEELEVYNAGGWVDWIDEVSQNAQIQNYNLSISGNASDKVNYYLSAGYMKQDGLIVGDDYKKLTFMAKMDAKVTDWLTVGMRASYYNASNPGQIANIQSATWLSPYSHKYVRYDGYTDWYERYANGNVASPFWSSSETTSYLWTDREKKYDNLNGTGFVQIDFPFVKGLSYKFTMNAVKNTNNVDMFVNPQYFLDTRKVEELADPYKYTAEANGKSEINQTYAWTMDNVFTYTKDFGKNHLDAMLGYTRDATHQNQLKTAYSGFKLPTVLGSYGQNLATTQQINKTLKEWQNVGYMARVNYNYANKYYLTANFRRDGFSGFAKGSKWANFPGVSAAWTLSQEDFMQNVIPGLSFLKLRGSYGLTGNQSIEAYATLATVASGYTWYDASSLYIYQNSLANEELTWATTKTGNFGLDFGFLDGRISGSIDVYKSKTNDMLLNRSLPYMTGFSEAKFNAGEVMNRGVELSLNTVNINGDGKDNFRWESGLTFYRNKNKIVHLFGKDANGKEANDTGNATTNGYETARALVIGESINAAWDLKMLGIFQSQAEIDSYVDANGNKIQPDAVPGDIKFLDYNGDGKISTDDRHCIGDMDPLFTINFSNTLSWKNFSLYFNFRWDAGNSSHFIGSDPFGNYHNTATTSGAQLKVAPWSENNPTNEHPRLGYVNTYSYYFWSQRQYLKLKDLSLSYTFDQPWVKKANIQNLRLYLSGTDLFTITGWSGLDPETGGTIAAGPGSSRYGSKPAYRTLTIGANITF